ncbi:Mitogen-activated protein kinase kinase kinase [Thalictrum thalictroides]|uniref:Mitogen-activated protein kinase kinase kinase n=1 Tax=Thalictrum thalictroides TaxID=46969 RepID=A0A7J6UZU6_THATH|nr:Mitogen-activated protein kinase kinase kinase [Thalictrum thalictroides]
MAEEQHRLVTSEGLVMRNMEGFIPNPGIQNVINSRSRQMLYPVSSDAGLGYGNQNMGRYPHYALPVTSGGLVENPHFVYQAGGIMAENPNLVNRVGGGIVENPSYANRAGGGMVKNSNFVNRVGGGFGESPTSDIRSNASDYGIDESVEDQSSVRKVKFLCSFRGNIIPRPGDGVLRYVGGQTRIISVRRDIRFQDLVHKMVDVYGKPVVIKYQLPDEELDALVSVLCPEDLENMMEEYEKLVESSSDGSAKLRVFLFSASELDSSCLLQFNDILDSGQRYIDAVNGIPDGSCGRITRKVSIGSETSTQNSEGTIGGSEGVDNSSLFQGDGSTLSSPYMLSSPRVGASSSCDIPTSVVYVAPNHVVYAPSMPVGPLTVLSGQPQTLSSIQSEPDFKRPVPPVVQPQMAQFSYDLQRSAGMDVRPATPYIQAYMDPQQQLSSQVGHLNPHGVGIAGSIYRYAEPSPQLRDNVVGIAHQQFIPAVPMSGIHTNVVQSMQPPQSRSDVYLGENAVSPRNVQLPVEQNSTMYQTLSSNSPLYQQQSLPHPAIVTHQAGGYGGGQMPPPQPVMLSDEWIARQRGLHPERPPYLGDCIMCQKALPHAHSDTVVLNNRDHIASTVSDTNLVFHGAHLDNLGVQPLNRINVSGSSGEAEYQISGTQPRVISQIDNAMTQSGMPSFSQGLEVQLDKDRMVPKRDPPDNPGLLFSHGVIEKPIDVKSPYGVIVQDDIHQQSSVPNLYQVKQGSIVNLPLGSDSAPVNIRPVQTSKPMLFESSTEFYDKNTGLIVKEDASTSCIPCDQPPAEVLESKEQCTSSEDVSLIRPQILEHEMFPSNAFPTSGLVADGNEIMLMRTMPPSSSGHSGCNTSYPDGDTCKHSPSNSLFSNNDPWTLQHDSQFPPLRTNKESANEEAFITREEEFFQNPSGHSNKDSSSELVQPCKDMAEECIMQGPKAVSEEALPKPGHLNRDSHSEHTHSNKDVADENIKRELKAVAENVAAVVLHSSTSNDSVVHESSPEVSHGRGGDSGVEAKITTEDEDVKTELPQKANSGPPLSKDIGRLQIIKNSDLEELTELGSGTFGTVYHGKWRGTDVAIKRFNDRCFSGKPSEQSRMIDDFWNEAINLADLHHPNVVAFYGVVLDGPGDSVAAVTEYMVNGSLRQALQRPLDKRKRLMIAMDVAFGMEYLHGKNIVHFDLKSDNLLVNLRDPHRPICKVGDLGLSKVKCHTLISGGVRGTLPWMAPELLNGSSSLVSEKVDVFSFGIVMWELLTGEEPYADLHYGVIIGGIVSNTLRPTVPESCDPGWRSLMETCWSSDPSQRPSFTEIADQLRSMAASLTPKTKQ